MVETPLRSSNTVAVSILQRLHEVEGLYNNGSKDLFHMLLAPGLSRGILRPFDAMQQLRGSDGGNEGLGSWMLPQEPRHVELAAFVGDKDRRIQDQSHADLSGGRVAFSMSSAKALASSGGSFCRVGQRSASSAQVRAAFGKGLRVATGLPSRIRIADSRLRSTRSSNPRKSFAASVTEMAVSPICWMILPVRD